MVTAKRRKAKSDAAHAHRREQAAAQGLALRLSHLICQSIRS